jgi:hypothetical protein
VPGGEAEAPAREAGGEPAGGVADASGRGLTLKEAVMALIDFPYANISSIVPFRVDTPPGMFAFRYMSTLQLLDLPILSNDLSDEDRKAARESFTVLQRPLTALALFWSVISLEELVRDFGTRLAGVKAVAAAFPNIGAVAVTPLRTTPTNPSKRTDKDAVSYLDITALNNVYIKAIGTAVIDPSQEPRLTDLAIIRHTIAHHAAVARAIDMPRFRHYRVQPGRILNPPAVFVKDTAYYLYQLGKQFLDNIQKRLFQALVDPHCPLNQSSPPAHVVELVELFDYFGKLSTKERHIDPITLSKGSDAINHELQRLEKEARDELLRECLSELA